MPKQSTNMTPKQLEQTINLIRGQPRSDRAAVAVLLAAGCLSEGRTNAAAQVLVAGWLAVRGA